MDALRAVRQKGQINCPLAFMELLAPPYDTSTITATNAVSEDEEKKREEKKRLPAVRNTSDGEVKRPPCVLALLSLSSSSLIQARTETATSAPDAVPLAGQPL